MALGFVGSGGVAAIQAGLRQRLMERAMAERQAQELELKKHQLGLDMRAADRADEALRQNEAYRQDALAERTAAAQAAAGERELTGTQALNNAIPAGRYPATPETTPIMGRLVKIGAATPVDATLGSTAIGGMSTLPAPGAVTQGTLTKTEQPAQAAGFEKRASVSQQAAQDAAAAKVEAARVATETRANENEQKAKDRLAQIQAAAAAAQGNRGLQDEMVRLRIQAEKDKQDAARTATTDKAASARQQTQMALDLVNRLETHPGLNRSTGIIDSMTSGFSQEATDANGLRDQLVATLTLPNLGALKGPMSDRDVIFIKQLATRLGNPKLSDSETRKALSEAKTFLLSKSEAQGGGPGAGGGGSAAPSAPAGWRYVPKPGGGWTAVEERRKP